MWDIWVVLRHLPWLSHRLTFEFLDNPLKRKLKSHALGDLLIFLLMNLLIFQHKHGFTIFNIYIYILYHYNIITYYHYIWLSLSDITIHHQALAEKKQHQATWLERTSPLWDVCTAALEKEMSWMSGCLVAACWCLKHLCKTSLLTKMIIPLVGTYWYLL
jgi:hypothetical protein